MGSHAHSLLLPCLIGGVGGSLLDLEAVEAEVAGYEDTVPRGPHRGQERRWLQLHRQQVCQWLLPAQGKRMLKGLSDEMDVAFDDKCG
jgi:hypothetical protein